MTLMLMFSQMFSLIQCLLESPEAMYTHINLSNGNSTHYPLPGYFTTTPSSLTLNSAGYDGQDSACRDGPASGMGQHNCH
mmetsp:Transcript_37956/g.76767  ORF Transcript_37956/g.76767 Transcript_37956/m.76767 type:complete len:80 (+) Transcript_37956:89-328(+)|eukprot:CAMPEP_0202815610 /NCGR_PEP_ID=MMETSP1389-20130828/6353_1 /ASSEMBLY_ACC=CAM_ASM_000865 /TAXON_ID=302021 /ORGANISM="Rhodomonas sp., Strain CCMP768" /LENGTH=79 /DNA_ID=CAMNT_0049487533 /DNA_START=38 /DNA_END=277 /DNA_ORIENTATION=-